MESLRMMREEFHQIIIVIKMESQKKLRIAAIILLLLMPVPNSKIFIFSGLAVVFQFFNLMILFFTSEFQFSLLIEFGLTILYIVAVFTMSSVKDQLFKIGSILSVLWLILISKIKFISNLEFILPVILYLFLLIFIWALMNRNKKLKHY